MTMSLSTTLERRYRAVYFVSGGSGFLPERSAFRKVGRNSALSIFSVGIMATGYPLLSLGFRNSISRDAFGDLFFSLLNCSLKKDISLDFITSDRKPLFFSSSVIPLKRDVSVSFFLSRFFRWRQGQSRERIEPYLRAQQPSKMIVSY